MKTPSFSKEESSVCRNRLFFPEDMVQRGNPRAFGVSTLHGLIELLGIAEQDDTGRRLRSLLLLGLIANEFTRRIYGPGQAGGGNGIRTNDTKVAISARPATILLRNDWLSSLIGALLCWPGCGRGALWDHALPGSLLGRAEVVRRMASH
jgi:hypothetical protein